MADAEEGKRPIIKRKKVISGGGHHGGAWKVAYADFVTAMMAFFLLMWLLNATTESQRKGIADYFAPVVPVSPVSGGGDGMFAGDSVFEQDTLRSDGIGGAEGKLLSDDGAAGETPGSRADDEKVAFEAVETRLAGLSGESEVADDLMSHIVTRVTDEGLVIDVFAREGRPLFTTGSDQPTEKMQAILEMIGGVIHLVKNEIAISGHTDAAPFARKDENDNWRLSAARADSSRRALMQAGVEQERFRRVTGEADRDLALPEQPGDPRNRRVTITLLRSDR